MEKQKIIWTDLQKMRIEMRFLSSKLLNRDPDHVKPDLLDDDIKTQRLFNHHVRELKEYKEIQLLLL